MILKLALESRPHSCAVHIKSALQYKKPVRLFQTLNLSLTSSPPSTTYIWYTVRYSLSLSPSKTIAFRIETISPHPSNDVETSLTRNLSFDVGQLFKSMTYSLQSIASGHQLRSMSSKSRAESTTRSADLSADTAGITNHEWRR